MLRGELCVLRGELGWEVGTLRGELGIDCDLLERMGISAPLILRERTSMLPAVKQNGRARLAQRGNALERSHLWTCGWMMNL